MYDVAAQNRQEQIGIILHKRHETREDFLVVLSDSFKAHECVQNLYYVLFTHKWQIQDRHLAIESVQAIQDPLHSSLGL